MQIFLPLLLIIPFAIACNNNTDIPKVAAQDDTVKYTQPPPEKPKSMADEFVPVGDSVIVPPFEITVQLSATAEKKLSDAKETIIVSAIFSGVPIDTTMQQYQEWGEFNLGDKQMEMQAPGTVRFTDAKISTSDFEKLGSKDIKILINVFSVRKSTQDNLLACDILKEPISKVRLQKNVLKGKLIYE